MSVWQITEENDLLSSSLLIMAQAVTVSWEVKKYLTGGRNYFFKKLLQKENSQ